MEANIRIDPGVFNPVYIPHLENYARTQIFYGGSSSGKSVFLAQRDVIDLMKGGRNFLVCRQVGKTLRGSVVAEINAIISEWGLHGLFDVNKTDGTVTCKNGYQIVFAGLDDVEKLKSIRPARGVFTDIRIEEATEADRATVKQLTKRQRGGSDKTPKRMTLSFNPILKSHWIYQEYFAPHAWTDEQTYLAADGLTIQKTTYKDNCFLTQDDKKDLENETDKYYYAVYTLGQWGVLGHVIFTNWRVEDLSGMQEQFTTRRNGLDFGFSSDPAAAACMHYDRMRKRLYIFGELYERGLTNDLLADELKRLIGTERVTCDSAEPKSIKELQNYGINARGAKKGKDSVLFGIQWLQQQEIIVDAKCINGINELTQFHWKEDKDGNALREPVDKFNHFIDAVRYGTEEDQIVIERRAATSRQG